MHAAPKAPVLYTGKGWSGLAIALMAALAIAILVLPTWFNHAVATARQAEANKQTAMRNAELERSAIAICELRFEKLAVRIGEEQLPAARKYKLTNKIGGTPLKVGTYVLKKMGITRNAWQRIPPNEPLLVRVGLGSVPLMSVYQRKFPGEVQQGDIMIASSSTSPPILR